MLFVAVVVGFVVMLLLKLGPSFMGFWTLKSIMDGLAEGTEPLVGGKPAIMDRLYREMDMNNIRDIQPKDFKIKKSGDNAYDVTVHYEHRANIVANADVVLVFDHSVVVKGR